MSRSKLGALLIAALAFGGMSLPAEAGTVAPGSVTPMQDRFYAAPSSLPARPGTLLRSRAFTAFASPAVVNLGSVVPLPARGWQMMYRSTDARGRRIAVTGSVLVPAQPWTGSGRRPVVVYTPGTVGPGDICAPSYALAKGTAYESLLLAPLLLAGYAVVVPDFQGMGTSDGATYIVGKSEGRVALDSMRAAAQIAGTGISARAPLAIDGYSQGGGAAAWAGQLQPAYAPELNLKAVAAGGVPGNLLDLFAFLRKQGNLHLQVMALAGFHHAYPRLPWETLLTPLGRERIALLETKCELDPSMLGGLGADNTTTALAGLTFSDIFRKSPLESRRWRKRILQNSPGATKLPVPTLMYGSVGDEIISYAVQRGAFARYCSKGSTVEWQDTLPLTHATAALAWSAPVAGWIGARFNGAPARSSC